MSEKRSFWEKIFHQKTETTSIRNLNQVIEPYLSDPKRLNRVLDMVIAAQKAIQKSNLDAPIRIIGSSVTGKPDADIDVYLDKPSLYSRDHSTGDYLHLKPYEKFLDHFKFQLEKISTGNRNESTPEIHNLFDSSQVEQLPKNKYGYSFTITPDNFFIDTNNQRFKVDLGHLPRGSYSLENLESVSKELV